MKAITQLLLLSTVIPSEPAFRSQWQTDKPGDSNNFQITLPLEAPGVGGSYNFNVLWGDGNSDTITVYNEAAVTHTYAVAGTYTVTITGIISGFRFNNGGDRRKLLDIQEWGVLNVGNNGGYFSGCENLIGSATDALDLTGTTNLAAMFFDAPLFNGAIGNWDVSAVTNMESMFDFAESFNQPLNDWDVSSVTDMSFMFADTLAFNQPLNDWIVSAVTNMQGMFEFAELFDQPLNSWTVSAVTNMQSMFETADVFNQDIGSWTVTSVTDMSFMFSNCPLFNNGGMDTIKGWDVSSVTNMRSMFGDTPTFNQPLNDWTVSSVTNMQGMFEFAESFDQPLNSWDVSSVTDMLAMFEGAAVFNQDIGSWIVTSVTNMSAMFFSCSLFNNGGMDTIDDWTVSSVTDMSNMFFDTPAFNQPLNSWDVSSVTNMRGMFESALLFDQPLNSWIVSAVTNMNSMFESTPFNQNIGGWTVTSVEDMGFMFFNCALFNNDGMDTIKDWDVSSVTDMQGMFGEAIAFDQPIGDWTVSAVITMEGMFEFAELFNQPLNSWDVSSVTNMSFMFGDAHAFNQPLNLWIVSSVTDMQSMFADTVAFNQPLNSWTVSAVANMQHMFLSADAFNQPLNLWDVSSVTNMSLMFRSAILFDQDIGSWDVSNVTSMTNMFTNVTLGITNYNSLLENWALLTLTAGVTLDAGNSQYSAGDPAAARAIIVATPWTISDGGVAPATFRSQWQTANAGTSLDNQITLPLEGLGTNNFNVKWGDGNSDAVTGDSPITHTYDEEGIYNVEITGSITGFRFNNGGDALKLLDIHEWGVLNVGNSRNYFYGCENLIGSATDALDLTGTTDLVDMFRGCSLFNGAIGNWDVSAVTLASGMFRGASLFNQDLGGWVVGSISSFSNMFRTASSFNNGSNPSIKDWDMSTATHCNDMFSDTPFDQDIGSWDVSNVTSMTNMFSNVTLGITNYNSLLEGWALLTLTAGVTLDAGNSQYSAGDPATARATIVATPWTINDGGVAPATFRSQWQTANAGISGSNEITLPLEGLSTNNFNVKWGDGNSDAAVTSDTPITHTYDEEGIYNVEITGDITGFRFANTGDALKLLDIQEWGVLNVGNNNAYFRGCSNLTGSATDALDLTGTTDLQHMFRACSQFNGVIDNWDVSAVLIMRGLFRETSFNQSLSGWDVSAVTDMSTMFRDTTAFNQDISGWTVSAVLIMNSMFRDAAAFDQNIGGWDVSAVTNLNNMFEAAIFNQDISGWTVSAATSMGGMFNSNEIFDQDISSWDVSSVTNMANMFIGAELSTTNYDALLEGWWNNLGFFGNLQPNINFHGGSSKYSAGAPTTARGLFVSTFNWTILDGGQVP